MNSCPPPDSAQAVTNRLGLWVFLATEVLFFGGMFLAYALYRHTYPAAFSAGSHLMEFGLGTANAEVACGLLDRPVQGEHPGADHHRDERQREHDVRDQDGGHPERRVERRAFLGEKRECRKLKSGP